ncbi:hypothetical protein BJ878DRAFT_579317 [Calycina marina]|uniref:Biotrophy-associated secreted protein 2 n=1 Tax=Calycina marina TaxID=1763456 RepID=A0A9P8CCB7_9HELO|nr:hypothetical protein BJ878DRAFT_579317 [Calycina marina]
MVHITLAAVFTLFITALAVTPNDAGAKSVGLADGQQCITGSCTSNADCQSACCAGNPTMGVCSAEAASLQSGKTGCGFVDPNAPCSVLGECDWGTGFRIGADGGTVTAAKAQVAKQGFRRSLIV